MSNIEITPQTTRASSHSRLLRANTLVRIRWLAIFCQTVTVTIVALYFNFYFALATCIFLIAMSAWLNIFLTFRYPQNHRLSFMTTSLILGFDICQLAVLLYFTGGLHNPFAILIIVPVVISATVLPIRHISILVLLSLIFTSLLAVFHQPLPWFDGTYMKWPGLIILGIWTAIISTLGFSVYYAYRVAEEARLLGDALLSTELILQREIHISDLDGLAAAAAHELGTPLATIQLTAREMQLSNNLNDQDREDIELIVSQAQRCRDILKRLQSLKTDSAEHLGNLPMSLLIAEISEPYLDFGIEIISLPQKRDIESEPIISRNPAILYGLGNLIENAVEFARSKVIVEWQKDDKNLSIKITDDGKGYSNDILADIGEPYMSKRVAEQRGGGLGLGLFIAKTLLERSGAKLIFQNSSLKDYGAEVTIFWPRESWDGLLHQATPRPSLRLKN